MRYQLETEIDIDASAATVWDILVHLDDYADWNPFIVAAAGTVAVGQRLTNRMQPPGGKGMTFKPTVTEVKDHQVFEWLGRPGLPGIFDGRHRFELIAGPNGGTCLVHTEKFSGILVRFMRKSLDTQTLAGFHAMNEALKVKAEAKVECRS